MSSNYNQLMNKYNLLVAKCKSMEESIKSKDKQWAEKAEEFKVVEDNTKKLCKLILAKDKNQINLGTEAGSWLFMQTRELIEQAMISYKKYNKERALALQNILDVAEDRQLEIDGLKDELAYYKNNSEGNEADYEEYKAKKEHEEQLQEAIDNSDLETKNNINKNNIKVTQVSSPSAEDFLNMAFEELSNDTNISEQSLDKNSNGRVKTAREKQRQKKVMKKFSDEMDFGKYVDDLSELQKDIILTIGNKGFSELREVVQYLSKQDNYKNLTEKSSQNKMYTAVRELQVSKIISAEEISIPLPKVNKTKIIQLTELGSRIFRMIANKNPVLAEASEIITEHDNMNHGYGIKCIYTEMVNSHLYSDVNMNCRKSPLIVDPKSSKDVKYIPDIIAIPKKSKKKCYFEYERGHSSRDTIIEKCNKMVRFTRDLYFIVDNEEKSGKTLMSHLSKWKEEAMKRGLKVRIYLSGMRRFVEFAKCNIDEPWRYMWSTDSSEPTDLKSNNKDFLNK